MFLFAELLFKTLPRKRVQKKTRNISPDLLKTWPLSLSNINNKCIKIILRLDNIYHMETENIEILIYNNFLYKFDSEVFY